jgi:epoxyqueuosine reductase QueG
VLGNSGDATAAAALETAAHDPDAIVRAHADWALARIGRH